MENFSRPERQHSTPVENSSSPEEVVQEVRNKAFGIDTFEPTGFGKWAVYAYKEINNKESIAQKKTELKERMDQRAARFNKMFKEILAGPGVDSEDATVRMERQLSTVYLIYGDSDNKKSESISGLVWNNNIKLEDDEKELLSVYLEKDINSLYSKMSDIYRENNTPRPAEFDNKVYQMALKLNALRIELKKSASSIPEGVLSGSDNLLFILSAAATSDEYILKDPHRVYRDNQNFESKFEAEFKDNESILHKAANLIADYKVGSEVEYDLYMQFFTGKIKSDKLKHLPSYVGEINSKEESYYYNSNINSVMSNLNFLKKNIDSLETIMEGGVPDPTTELRMKIKQEVERLGKVRDESDKEIHRLKSLLIEEEKRMKDTDDNLSKLEGTQLSLQKVSEKVKEASNERIRKDLLRKSIGSEVNPQAVVLEDRVLQDPDQRKKLINNPNTLAEIYSLDEQKQSMLKDQFKAINGLIPLLDNEVTASTVQETIFKLFDNIRDMIGREQIDKMKTQLADLEKPVQTVSLSEDLAIGAKEALRKSSEVK
jgi:hypothetical protein